MIEMRDNLSREESRLIKAIFYQAIFDVCAAPTASPDPTVFYRDGSKKKDSQDAKQFLSQHNEWFCYYAVLLGREPDYLERKVNEFLKANMYSKRWREKLSMLGLRGMGFL